MNTNAVKDVVEKHGIITVKADKTHDPPEINQLMVELGNTGGGIPFLAIFPAGGGDPLTFDGPLTEQTVIDALESASSGGGKATAVTAAHAEFSLAQ